MFVDMNKYQNGKIYKIVDVGYNKCYIGSTTETVSQRMARHRNCYKACKSCKKARQLALTCLKNTEWKIVKLNLLNVVIATRKKNAKKRGRIHQEH